MFKVFVFVFFVARIIKYGAKKEWYNSDSEKNKIQRQLQKKWKTRKIKLEKE